MEMNQTDYDHFRALLASPWTTTAVPLMAMVAPPPPPPQLPVPLNTAATTMTMYPTAPPLATSIVDLETDPDAYPHSHPDARRLSLATSSVVTAVPSHNDDDNEDHRLDAALINPYASATDQLRSRLASARASIAALAPANPALVAGAADHALPAVAPLVLPPSFAPALAAHLPRASAALLPSSPLSPATPFSGSAAPIGHPRGSTPTPCGRRLRVNDLVYRCATCGADPTCVLCAGCFATQDHAGHDVYVHASSGSGCCDCGDPDAWRRELHCAIHGTCNYTGTDDPMQ